MDKVTLEIEFEIGTLAELGYGGFKQSWINADVGPVQFSLTCGAGVGSPYMEASAIDGDTAVYARADASRLAPKVWDLLAARLPGPRKEAGDADGRDPGE
jgi:hypothetical protein